MEPPRDPLGLPSLEEDKLLGSICPCEAGDSREAGKRTLPGKGEDGEEDGAFFASSK